MSTEPVPPAGEDTSGPGPRLESVSEEALSEFRILSGGDDSQPTLFSEEELKVPERPPSKYNELLVPTGGIAKYRKGIAALHSIPITGAHTLNSRRIQDAIVALVQIHFKRLPKHQVETLREMQASPLFRVTKGELRTTAGIASKDFTRVEAVLELLHDMKISWNVMGEDSKIEWQMNSRFLASYGVGVGRLQGEVCFSIDPRVLELILEPRLWVTLNLDVQKQLGTETSYALYQQVWRYIGTTNKVTADFPVATWIELLTGPCRYVKTDEVTGEKHVVDYSEWKARYLKPAIAKVNSVGALAHTIELSEKRAGLKVKRLQFKFIRKRQEKLDLPLTWPDPLVDALKSLGFEDDELAELAQGFSLDEVVEALNRFEQAEKRMAQAKKRISSPKAFFTGILSNVNTSAALNDMELVELEKKAREEEAERRARDNQERASFEFNAYQTRRLIDNLALWPEARRQELFSAFEASPDFGKAKLLVSKGWDKAGVGAWVLLKAWLFQARADEFNELLPNPEDRTLEAWLFWRLEAAASPSPPAGP